VVLVYNYARVKQKRPLWWSPVATSQSCMLAAKRAARNKDITPKITGAREHGAVKPAGTHARAAAAAAAAAVAERGWDPSAYRRPGLPEPTGWSGQHAGDAPPLEPEITEEEQERRTAMIEALKRELQATEVRRSSSRPRRASSHAACARADMRPRWYRAQIHMDALQKRQAVLTDRIEALEAGGVRALMVGI
jgi:hypothetical protein